MLASMGNPFRIRYLGFTARAKAIIGPGTRTDVRIPRAGDHLPNAGDWVTLPDFSEAPFVVLRRHFTFNEEGGVMLILHLDIAESPAA